MTGKSLGFSFIGERTGSTDIRIQEWVNRDIDPATWEKVKDPLVADLLEIGA